MDIGVNWCWEIKVDDIRHIVEIYASGNPIFLIFASAGKKRIAFNTQGNVKASSIKMKYEMLSDLLVS